MAGFKYYTISADEKMKGLVTAQYIRSRMMNKNIEGMGMNEDGTVFELYLSDGANVNFSLTGMDGPEIQYRAPDPPK